jgi:hypothetical protein
MVIPTISGLIETYLHYFPAPFTPSQHQERLARRGKEDNIVEILTIVFLFKTLAGVGSANLNYEKGALFPENGQFLGFLLAKIAE